MLQVNNPDRIFQNRVKKYGAILPIAVSGLASLLKNTPEPKPISDVKTLKSFRYIDPAVDSKPAASITPTEVVNLVIYGKFVVNRYISAYPSHNYTIPRQSLTTEVVDDLVKGRVVMIHSRLGNGKSIFLYNIAMAMTSKGFRSFSWRGLFSTIERELDALRKAGRIFIVIDDYDAAAENISRLATALPEARFAVAARSSQQAVRLHEIRERFPKPLKLFAIDQLDSQDKIDLQSLLSKSGLSASGLDSTITASRELREVVVAFYKNAEITRKIRDIMQPLLANDASKFVLVATNLARWAGVDLTSDFISRAGNIDAFSEIMKYQNLSQDIFSTDETGFIGSRSALFSQYLLEAHFSSSDITNSCLLLIVAAVRRKAERKYRKLMGALMQVGNLKRMMQNKEESESNIQYLFERLARDVEVNQEPLFWLQYAILMMDLQEYGPAESFLATSYERAATSVGFETYQIDTQALRINLIIETLSTSMTLERFDKIIEGFRDIQPMLSEESHRFYAIKVVEHISPFFLKRKSAMTIHEINALVFEGHRLTHALGNLDPQTRAETGSELVRAELLKSIFTLSATI